jgi:hypothetical protein
MAIIAVYGAYASSWDPDSPEGGTPYAAFDGSGSTRWTCDLGVPSWIVGDMGGSIALTRVTITWQSAYATDYLIQLSDDGSSWTTVVSASGQTGGTDDWTGLTGSGRFLRVYSTAITNPPFTSIYQIDIEGTVTTDYRTPRSGASASNTAEGASALGIDGNIATRWGSNGGVGSWIYVDMGTTQNVTSVAILWEAAEATYNVQTSPNATDWTTQGTTVGSTMPPVFSAVACRYVRILSTALLFSPFMSAWEVYPIAGASAAGGVVPPAPLNPFFGCNF